MLLISGEDTVLFMFFLTEVDFFFQMQKWIWNKIRDRLNSSVDLTLIEKSSNTEKKKEKKPTLLMDCSVRSVIPRDVRIKIVRNPTKRASSCPCTCSAPLALGAGSVCNMFPSCMPDLCGPRRILPRCKRNVVMCSQPSVNMPSDLVSWLIFSHLHKEKKRVPLV